MGDEEDNFPGLEFAEGSLQMVAGVAVEPGGGFVEKEDGSVGGEGAGKGDALPLSHTEFGATVEEASQHSVFFLWEAVDNRVGSREAQGIMMGLGRSRHHVVRDREVVADKVLEENAHA